MKKARIHVNIGDSPQTIAIVLTLKYLSKRKPLKRENAPYMQRKIKLPHYDASTCPTKMFKIFLLTQRSMNKVAISPRAKVICIIDAEGFLKIRA